MRLLDGMRRSRLSLPAGGLVLALALAPLGCNRAPQPTKAVAPEGEAIGLASTVRTSEPSQEAQLLEGFYGIEANAWRWTDKQFKVVLRPPAGSAQNGATLVLSLTIPQVAIDHAKSLALSASVEGTPLGPETYTKPGQYEYKRDVPASALGKQAVRVQFALDNAIPPTGAERRELGVIVGSIGLQGK